MNNFTRWWRRLYKEENVHHQSIVSLQGYPRNHFNTTPRSKFGLLGTSRWQIHPNQFFWVVYTISLFHKKGLSPLDIKVDAHPLLFLRTSIWFLSSTNHSLATATMLSKLRGARKGKNNFSNWFVTNTLLNGRKTLSFIFSSYSMAEKHMQAQRKKTTSCAVFAIHTSKMYNQDHLMQVICISSSSSLNHTRSWLLNLWLLMVSLRTFYLEAVGLWQKSSTLRDAQGIHSSLWVCLPEFTFPLSQKCSEPVVVGKWYCPFMFHQRWEWKRSN